MDIKNMTTKEIIINGVSIAFSDWDESQPLAELQKSVINIIDINLNETKSEEEKNVWRTLADLKYLLDKADKLDSPINDYN